MKLKFYENNEGIHAEGLINDYTLCGMTLCGDPTIGYEQPIATTKQRVTCPECILHIQHARKYKCLTI